MTEQKAQEQTNLQVVTNAQLINYKLDRLTSLVEGMLEALTGEENKEKEKEDKQ